MPDLAVDTKPEAPLALKPETKSDKKPEIKEAKKVEIKRLEREFTVWPNGTFSEDVVLSAEDLKSLDADSPELSNEKLEAINLELNTNQWLAAVSIDPQDLEKVKDNNPVLEAQVQSALKAYLEKNKLALSENQLSELVTLQANNIINNKQQFNAVHGSGSGTLDTKFQRIFKELKSGSWLAGDLNVNLLEEDVRKQLHSYLAKNKLAISDEGLDALVKQQVILCKMRCKSIINPQQAKIFAPDSFIKEAIGKLIDITYLPEDAPIALIKFKKDPMDKGFKRADILKLTQGVPTYALFDGNLIYITTNGQPAKIRGLNLEKTNDRLLSVVFDEMQEDVIQEKPTKLQLSVIKEFSEHKAHMDCVPLPYIAKLESLAQINAAFMKDVSKLPVKNVETIKQLIKDKYPEIINYYDPRKSYGHDHIPLSAYEEVKSLEGVVITKNVNMSLNSMDADAVSEQHFTTALTPATWNDYDTMFDSLSGVVLREALNLLQNRKLVTKTDKLTQELSQVPYTFNRPQNFDVLMQEDTVVETFAGPCKVPTHYSQLVELYQKEIKDPSFPELTEDELRTYFNNVYNSDAFQRINNLKPVAATAEEKIEYEKILKLEPSKRTAEEAIAFEVLRIKVLKPRFTDAFEKIRKTINHAIMDKDFRKGFQKAQNCVFAGVTNIKIPGSNDNSLSPMTSGFSPLQHENGQIFTADEHKDMQIQFMKNYIYRQHLLHPDATLTFSLVEAGSQTEKKMMLLNTLRTINAFVLAGNNATAQQQEAYYQLMSTFDETLDPRELSLGSDEERAAESVVLTASQEKIRAAGIPCLNASEQARESKDAVTIHTTASSSPKLQAPQGHAAFYQPATKPSNRMQELLSKFEGKPVDHFANQNNQATGPK